MARLVSSGAPVRLFVRSAKNGQKISEAMRIATRCGKLPLPRFMSIGTSPTRKGGTASGGNKAGAKRHKIHKSILCFLCLFVAVP